MSTSQPEETLPDYPTCACADCLEKAMGRQQKHNPPCWIDKCQICGHKTTVYDPVTFGNPKIEKFQSPAEE